MNKKYCCSKAIKLRRHLGPLKDELLLRGRPSREQSSETARVHVQAPLGRGLSLTLPNPVFRLGGRLGRGAQKLHDSFAGGVARSLLEEVGCGFHHSNFFGDCCRDPLVKDTPSSFASRCAAFLMESGSFNGQVDLLMVLSLTSLRHHRFHHIQSSCTTDFQTDGSKRRVAKSLFHDIYM